MNFSFFPKLLGTGMVIVVAAVVISGCRLKETPTSVKPPSTENISTTQTRSTTDTSSEMIDNADYSTLTPEQEVDAAIKEMDAALNQIKPDDLSGSDFE